MMPCRLYLLYLWVVIALFGLSACGQDRAEQTTPPTDKPAHEQTAQPAGKTPRLIDVTLSFIKPRFRPGPIEVQVGEPIQFKLSSADTRHTFVIEPLGIDIEVPQTSMEEVATTAVVVPQEVGSFRVYCRVHSRMQMETTLIVSEKKP